MTGQRLPHLRINQRSSYKWAEREQCGVCGRLFPFEGCFGSIHPNCQRPYFDYYLDLASEGKLTEKHVEQIHPDLRHLFVRELIRRKYQL